MGTGCCRTGIVRSALVVAITLMAVPALAQHEVMLIVGNGVTPPQLREGSMPRTGDFIQADQQTVIVLKRKWDVERTQAGRTVCEDWVVLRGNRYRVEGPTPGVCKRQGSGNEVERAIGGVQMMAHLTVMFIDSPKADDPSFPKQLLQLQGDVARAKRTRTNGRGRQGAVTPPQGVQGRGQVVQQQPRPRGALIHARYSSLQCLHRQYDNWQNGNPIHLWQCNAGAPDMRMWVFDEKTGYIRSAANPAKCWHKARGDWANGNPIHLWDCDDGVPGQKTWTYDHTTGLIRSRVNLAKCIHKKSGGFENGNPVHLWDCAAGTPEFKSWTLRVQQARLED